MVKRLLAVLEKRPLIAGWIWICLIPPGLLFWADALPFVVIMSIYANIEASFATNAAKKEGVEMRERMTRMEAKLDLLLANQLADD